MQQDLVLELRQLALVWQLSHLAILNLVVLGAEQEQVMLSK